MIAAVKTHKILLGCLIFQSNVYAVLTMSQTTVMSACCFHKCVEQIYQTQVFFSLLSISVSTALLWAILPIMFIDALEPLANEWSYTLQLTSGCCTAMYRKPRWTPTLLAKKSWSNTIRGDLLPNIYNHCFASLKNTVNNVPAAMSKN